MKRVEILSPQFKPIGVGTFHQWGTDTINDETTTIAIVEEDNGRMMYVQVVFESSSKRYTYVCESHLEVGDTVIVDSPFDGLVRVEVVAIVATKLGVKGCIKDTFDSIGEAEAKRQAFVGRVEHRKFMEGLDDEERAEYDLLR